ncbi:hypothetical protein [Polymorphospora rubra]|uniref:hypothetical protein n=1 Tax=Polymorphospora rubra TaxID=338584 RepID=UPI001BB3956B|nr:hypothetical protein [Polymorphospora rubra]
MNKILNGLNMQARAPWASAVGSAWIADAIGDRLNKILTRFAQDRLLLERAGLTVSGFEQDRDEARYARREPS